MFDKNDQKRDAFMLKRGFSRKGYDWWWHSFTAIDSKTGEEKQFFIEFFVINPKYGKKYPVFGNTQGALTKKDKPSYVMIKAGCWGEDHVQLHRFYGIKKVIIRPGTPFVIKAGRCYLSENETCGVINVTKNAAKEHPEWMSDAGKMEWKIKINKEIAYNVGYGAGKVMRELQGFDMYWHAEGMKSMYSGTVTLNGNVYYVIPEKSYGYADKNWGRDFTSPWLWLSSNKLYSRVKNEELDNSVFDIGGGRPRVFGIPLEGKLLGGFYYEGKEYDYNFSKVWTLSRQRFICKETEDKVIWKVWLENNKSVMKINVICEKKDMILVNYVAPDGSKKHDRLWNGGNGKAVIKLYDKHSYGLQLKDIVEARNVGCEYGEYAKQ